MTTPDLAAAFSRLIKLGPKDLKNSAVSAALLSIVESALGILAAQAVQRQVVSEVAGKRYFVFERKDGLRRSRPVNASLFDGDLPRDVLASVLAATVDRVTSEVLPQALYTSAMAYACAADITKTQDRKTPGTFFELMVGHLFARTYSANPARKVQVLNLDLESALPTDFVFDLGKSKSRIHLPVKTSTRERIIQVWAHQRVLDGIYGANRFRGILVCINETNMKTASDSVVEICLPGQWAIYQMFIAQLHRVYYLDVPGKYADLHQHYPFIQVKPFSAFFEEAQSLVTGPPA